MFSGVLRQSSDGTSYGDFFRRSSLRREEPGAHRIRRIVDAVTRRSPAHPAESLLSNGLSRLLGRRCVFVRPFDRGQEPGLPVGLSDAGDRALRQIKTPDPVDVADWLAAGMSRRSLRNSSGSKSAATAAYL